MYKQIWWALLGLTSIVAFSGCGGSGSDNNQNTTENSPPATTQNAATNDVTGRSFEFTVTDSVNFSEPVGAMYSINFHPDHSYTFHPSPQNREGQADENGTFTYDTSSGHIHFARPDHQDIDGTFAFETESSGNVDLAGPEGETEKATFVDIPN
jgi:hypothetical protein